MNHPIRVGIVGLGQRGLQHLNALWKLQNEGIVQIVALIDAFKDNLVAEKLEKYVAGFKPDGVHSITDFNEAIKNVSMDAIYFAMPPGRHNGEVIQSAEAGIHIFAEKPMSLYLNEAIEMEVAIRENGVIATAGFQQRYDSRHEAVHSFLSDKKLVMMTMIANSALEGHSVKHTPTEKVGGPSNRVWTANYAWSGSTVVEAGIHQVDLMRYWAGNIAWVEANYVHRDESDIADAGDNPYAYSVTFGFENGCIGHLILSRLRRVYYSDGYQSILWTHGHVKFEGNDVVAYYYDGPYPPEQRPERDEIRHTLALPPSVNSTEAISRAFCQAIAAKDTTSLRSTFSTSMNSLAAVLAANASDRFGGGRINLKDFHLNPKYDEFRCKPS